MSGIVLFVFLHWAQEPVLCSETLIPSIWSQLPGPQIHPTYFISTLGPLPATLFQLSVFCSWSCWRGLWGGHPGNDSNIILLFARGWHPTTQPFMLLGASGHFDVAWKRPTDHYKLLHSLPLSPLANQGSRDPGIFPILKPGCISLRGCQFDCLVLAIHISYN